MSVTIWCELHFFVNQSYEEETPVESFQQKKNECYILMTQIMNHAETKSTARDGRKITLIRDPKFVCLEDKLLQVYVLQPRLSAQKSRRTNVI